LILRKFIKIVAKRRQILHPKCTKFDVGSDPTGGAYGVPPDPIAGSKGPTSKGREGKSRTPKKKLAMGLTCLPGIYTDYVQTN